MSITIDIEDWYHIPSVTGSPFSFYRDTEEFFKKWDKRYDFLSQPTNKILKILDDFNVKATFFIVSDVINHYPELVESINDNGHEIACHGLCHACKIDPRTKIPLFSIKDFEDRTIFAKKQLEKISGQKVIGYRAPNALIGRWMLESLQKIGFRYDSSISINSLYNKADHNPDGVTSAPYYPTRNLKNQNDPIKYIREFPFSYWDICGLKIPTSGGPMLRFFGAKIILNGLRQSIKRGHTIFYFHPIDISDEVFPNVGKGRPFYWLIKGNIIEKRVRYILSQIRDIKKICLREYEDYDS